METTVKNLPKSDRAVGTGTHLRMLARACAVGALALALAGCASLPRADQAPRARNVIVMINDGAGWGTWDAAAYWQYGRRDGAPYAAFPARYGMTTFPLNTDGAPSGDSASRIGYDAARAWDVAATGDLVLPFAGYRYLAEAATDSAAAGTALASGVKTYNSAINHDNHGDPVEPVSFLAKAQGKATGVVTSVPFSHATPAAFGAQNASRNAYHEIARQMLSEGRLDLIMGTGAPGFDVNGIACDASAANGGGTGCDAPDQFMAIADWTRLAAGRYGADEGGHRWRLIRERAEFVALADGSLRVDGPLIGLPEVAMTLQQAREADVVGRDPATASGTAPVATVPSLATMTRGALRHLQARSDAGLFLMVEGGATDWAAHTSRCGTEWNYGACGSEPEYGRLIEETVDFNDAVAEVVAWVEAHSSWDETLLVVTTDHDNSIPLGPDAQAQPFQPVANRGKGRMPGITFRRTGGHANGLVPLWARGAGAEHFAALVRGRDPGYARHVGLNDGSYVDNTDVARLVRAALAGERPMRSTDAINAR
ncbi:alkaline phosphatase [Coralloluteibacterium stylophorae]